MINLLQNRHQPPSIIEGPSYFGLILNWIPRVNLVSIFSLSDQPRQIIGPTETQQMRSDSSYSSSEEEWECVPDPQEVKLWNERIGNLSENPNPPPETIVKVWRENLPQGTPSPIPSVPCLTRISSLSSIDHFTNCND